jgi:hypothetical protein
VLLALSSFSRADRTASPSQLASRARAAWATDATLFRAANSGERLNLRWQAAVRRQRAWGDALNALAPNHNDIVVIGASYK